MYQTLLLLCFMVFHVCAFAQQGSISGQIVSGGHPLEFVNVGLMETSLGTSTGADGNFKIDHIPYGDYSLVVSMVGYEMQIRKVKINSDHSNAEINISLKESTSLLESVVVTGTMKEVSRLESSVPVEVYSPEFFKANPTPSVFESLQNVNGVRPQINCNVCNTGDIHINGLEGPYTMVMIDGMPIVSGLSTVYGLTGIPQSLIDRVEIVKGPGSTLYGSEAVGGIINLITKKTENAPRAMVDVFGTTWQEINTDIGIKFNSAKNAQSLLGINYFNYQHPIDNNGDNFTDVTLQNRISVFNKWNFNRKQNRLFSIAGRYVYEDRWGGEMDWTHENRGGTDVYGESIYTSRWEVFGLYQLPFKENVNFQFSTNGHNQNSVYGDTEFLADQYIGFGQFTWNKLVGRSHEMLVGVAYRYTYYEDNTTATQSSEGNEPSITHLPGAFVQDEITINPTNKVLVGLRYDYNSIHGNIFTPRLNYKWNSRDNDHVIRLSVGNGYRVANVFTEDHAALTGARDVIFDGELEPETSWNANVNYVTKIVHSSNGFIGLDMSAWYTYFTNRIIPDYETDPNKIIYSNLDGSSVSKGVSINTDMAWGNGLKILAGATLMDVAVNEEGESYRQLLTESFSAVWSIGYEFFRWGLVIDYTGNLFGPMRLPLLGDLDERDPYSPWFSIQNIQLTKKLGKGWEIYGGVKNLLNFTPAANSIARAFDPFDENVEFDDQGNVIPTVDNPQALTFDPSYVYAPNQGIRGFLGVRYTLFD